MMTKMAAQHDNGLYSKHWDLNLLYVLIKKYGFWMGFQRVDVMYTQGGCGYTITSCGYFVSSSHTVKM